MRKLLLGNKFYLHRWFKLSIIIGCISCMIPSSIVFSPAAAVESLNPNDQAETFVNQGLAAYKNHQPEIAITFWQQALVIYQQTHATYRQSVTLNLLAAAHISLGQISQADRLLQQALPLSQQFSDLMLQAQILGNLGIAYRYQGLYAKALDVYQQSLALMRQQEDQNGELHILGLLGNVHESLGEYQEAIVWHQKSLAISQEENNWLGETTALVNLGAIQANLGNYNQAIDLYRRSHQISREYDDLQGIGLALSNLGSAHHALGQLDQAIDYYQDSLDIAQSLQNYRLEGETLGSLGLIYADLGELDKALDSLEASLAIANDIDDPKAIAMAHNNLGHTLFNAGQLEKAATHLYSAVETLESLRLGLEDSANVSVFDTHVLTYNLLQQILVTQGDIEAALEIAERSRARAFVELLANQSTDIREGFVDKAPTIEQIRQIAKDQNATIVEYTLVPDDSFKFQGKQRGTTERIFIWVVQPTGEVDFQEVDLRPLRQGKKLSIAELVKTSRDSIGLRGTQGETRSVIRIGDQVRRLDDQFDQNIYEVIDIDRQDQKVTLESSGFVLPNPVFSINDVYKVNVSSFATEFRPHQHWQDLHQLLIEPIANLLPTNPAARVVFIPQEQLFLVPFPALQAQDGSSLIEHHTILTAPAIQLLSLTDRPKPSSPTAAPLVVGNPNPMPEKLQSLPHAEAEANDVANILSTQPLIGETATETAVKQQIANAPLIHLATHGFFNEANPLQGSLALAPTNDEDGLLTAAEILTHRLQADLVVLSACDTGRGQITGDGVIGLSRSFLAAGASNVIVSLWQVPDDATAELMTEFYRQRQHLDNAQALRQAMLTTRDKHKDPKSWAAFTLIGAIEP